MIKINNLRDVKRKPVKNMRGMYYEYVFNVVCFILKCKSINLDSFYSNKIKFNVGREWPNVPAKHPWAIRKTNDRLKYTGYVKNKRNLKLIKYYFDDL